jgi:GMP synthase (glutamine-hydrolysing)
MSRADRIVVVDNGSRHLRALRRLCEAYADVEVTGADDLSLVEATDLVVLSGSHAHNVAGSKRFYAEERQLVASHKGPLIGICAGMELIASVYGGILGKLPDRQLGSRSILIEDASLRFVMGGLPSVRVAERHGWAVTHVIPPLIALAHSDGGVEVIRHQSRPIFGLQFHPELAPIEGRRIFEWSLLQAGLIVPLSL